MLFVVRRIMWAYQLLLQGLNLVLIKSFLLGKLFLSHLFGHLNSLHHLLFCLQMGFFNFCLQSRDKPKWLVISGRYMVLLECFTSILVLTEPSELPTARFLQTQSLCGPRLRLSNMKPASQTAPLLGGWSGSSGPHLEWPCRPGKDHQRDHDLIKC